MASAGDRGHNPQSAGHPRMGAGLPSGPGGTQQAPRTAASFWYARMLKLMERKGIRKSPAQTPGEFASAISDSQVHEEVVVFTEHYERARFDGSPEDAMRLPALYQELAGRK